MLILLRYFTKKCKPFLEMHFFCLLIRKEYPIKHDTHPMTSDLYLTKSTKKYEKLFCHRKATESKNLV